jgi:hypothetical protein
MVIHYNHKPDSITYTEYENNEYKMYVKCWCEKIRPIPVYIINFDELCSTIMQYKNKNNRISKCCLLLQIAFVLSIEEGLRVVTNIKN